jgi:uncharacterized membrane protein
MADDGQSAKPTVFVYLRPIIILGILLLAVGIGCDAKSQSNPGTAPPSFKNQSLQHINVYETDYADFTIAVTVTFGQGYLSDDTGRFASPTGASPTELSKQGYTDFIEKVDVTARPDGFLAGRPAGSVRPPTIVITSSTQPLAGIAAVRAGAPTATPVFRLHWYRASQLTSVSQAERFAVPIQLSQVQSNTWSGSAFFGPIPIIYQDNGSAFGHLPSIASDDPLGRLAPVLAAEYDRKTGELRNVVAISSPASAEIPAGDRSKALGTPVLNISYTEVIESIAPALNNEPIDYSIPPVDNSSDIDYRWHSNGVSGLDPIFKATDPNAVNFQNQAAFISGIAFGVAGAAAIAIVQELPKERKRKTLQKRAPKSP